MHELNLHLGDNPGHPIFAGSPSVGLAVELPVRLSKPVGSPELLIETTAIETHAEWQAHAVQLNGYLLGYLRDTNGQSAEAFRFAIPVELVDGAPRRLRISVGDHEPGLTDDFELKRVELGGCDPTAGWP